MCVTFTCTLKAWLDICGNVSFLSGWIINIFQSINYECLILEVLSYTQKKIWRCVIYVNGSIFFFTTSAEAVNVFYIKILIGTRATINIMISKGRVSVKKNLRVGLHLHLEVTKRVIRSSSDGPASGHELYRVGQNSWDPILSIKLTTKSNCTI